MLSCLSFNLDFCDFCQSHKCTKNTPTLFSRFCTACEKAYGRELHTNEWILSCLVGYFDYEDSCFLFTFFVPVDACRPKLPLCFLHCQLYNWNCAKAISLIFLATTFFSYSAWDWSSFTERRPRGVVLDFRRNGRPTLELEAQIFLVSGAFEEHKARGSLGVVVLLP